jgi:hypothetical protein
MESSRLDRVQIDVAGEIVEIAWKERDTLLRRLRAVAASSYRADRNFASSSSITFDRIWKKSNTAYSGARSC